MEIKNFLLKTKWTGALFLALTCLILSLRTGGQVGEVIDEAAPVIEKEASAFLPVTFEKGMIVKPENTVIERSYEENGQTYKIVLDTRTDYFEPQLLKDKGLYISRAAMYAYGRDIRIQDFKNMPDMVIDNELLSEGMNWLKTGFRPVLYGTLFAFSFIGALILIGINTLLLHWLVKLTYGAKLSQTVRLNTYAYILCAFTGLGFLLTLVISAGINFGVSAMEKEEQKSQ